MSEAIESTALVPSVNGGTAIAEAVHEPSPDDEQAPPVDVEFTVTGSDADRERLERICRAERIVQEKETVVEGIKEDLKDAKDEMDKAVTYLRKLIQEADSGSDSSMPLFDDDGKKVGSAAPVQDADVEDESWKSVPLSEALEGISETVLKKLADADLTTVGELQAYIAKFSEAGYTDPLTNIAGIGATTAEKIAEALEQFWVRRKG